MIYLDSAATTLQKPPAVARASAWAIQHLASPGRGGHQPAMAAAKIAYRCREEAAALFHVPTPEQVVFTFNATHGLNIAIKSHVKPGGRVVISGYEHNAVTRPLLGKKDVQVHVVQTPLFDQVAMVQGFRDALDQQTDVVVCTHVSNVYGYVLPIEEIAKLCRARQVPLVVDASQSAGCQPVDFQAMGASFIAMPGHKGLYGPQGTGLLLCAGETAPLLEGGTGSEAIRQEMPDFLPDRLEAGTHNIAGIAGLLEGIRFVRRRGIDAIAAHECRLIRQMVEGLSQLPELECFHAHDCGTQSGVLSFRLAGQDCEELGEMLGKQGIAVRAGLHCAPLAHQTVGTLNTGTIRASVSAFNTPQEIRQFLSTMGRISRKRRT